MPLSPSKLIPSPHKTERFSRAERIARRADYLRVQMGGRRVHTPHFVLMVMPYRGVRRLGITVTSKIGCAARRNRVKRVVREVFRRNRELFPDRCEIVMVARSGADRLGYLEVRDEVQGAQRALIGDTKYKSPIPLGD